MPVVATAEPTAADQQKAVYNANIGGQLNIRKTYSVSAGTPWCVVGTVVSFAATPALVESTLVPAIAALGEVTSVNGDQLYGNPPAIALPGTDELVLYVSSELSTTIGSGINAFARMARSTKSIKPPAGKKWCVFALRLAVTLDAAKITTLQTAMEGIAGITTAIVLVHGTIDTMVSGNASLTIRAHARIEETT